MSLLVIISLYFVSFLSPCMYNYGDLFLVCCYTSLILITLLLALGWLCSNTNSNVNDDAYNSSPYCYIFHIYLELSPIYILSKMKKKINNKKKSKESKEKIRKMSKLLVVLTCVNHWSNELVMLFFSLHPLHLTSIQSFHHIH